MRARRSEQETKPDMTRPGELAGRHTGNPPPPKDTEKVETPSDRSDEIAGARATTRQRGNSGLDGYDGIAHAIFDMPSPDAVHARCMAYIAAFKPSRLDYGSLADLLGEGSDVAYEARRLLANAKLARDNVERDSAIILSACRDAARAILEQQKRDGERAKQITDADVTDLVRARNPDEYQAQTNRVDRAKRMVDVLEGLIEDVVARARDLRQLVANARA